MRKSAVFCVLALTAMSACGGSDSNNGGVSGGANSLGGSSNVGGATETGGLVSTGGASLSTAGKTDSGGGQAGGGTSATGGSRSVGGSPGTGGKSTAAGGAGTGGNQQTGGKTTAGGGGAAGTGGTSATAGTSGMPQGGLPLGGTATAGSTSATGGTKAAGGGPTETGGTTTAGGTKVDGGTAGIAAGGSTSPGCAAPTVYPNLFVTLSGHTQQESDSKVSSAWSTLFNPSGSGTIYYDGPGSDESYVKDIYNGDVRTEGMSYGMTIAVQLGHQTEFDRIWTWVRNHMAKGCSGDTCTGEIAWSCPTSGNCNNGGAPDGEEYFATALIFAHTRWGDTGKIKYGTEAQWVLDLIRTKYFHTSPNIVKFGANSGFTDPSYVLPAFYQAWACFDTANAAFWNTAVTDGRAFFHNDVDGNGVCPYQASWTGSQTAGANSDSVRCVMNLMMDYNFFKADSWQSQTYAPKFAAHEKNAGPPSSYCDALLGFGLPASDGKAFVDKIWSANVPSHDYWNGVLYMLSLLHVSGNFKLYY